MEHSRTGTQWDWDTVELQHSGTGEKWDWGTLGLGQIRTLTQWDRDTRADWPFERTKMLLKGNSLRESFVNVFIVHHDEVRPIFNATRNKDKLDDLLTNHIF